MAGYQKSESSANQPLLPPVEDDIPFDTFDRELLAQLGDPDEFFGPRSFSPNNGPQSSTDASDVFRTPATILTRRFVEDVPTSLSTPFRGRESSSSDSGLQSSPLLRFFHPVRRDVQLQSDTPTKRGRHWPSDIEATVTQSSSRSAGKNRSSGSPTVPRQISLSHAPPVVQGIHLLSTHELPDRFRSLFPFPLLNAIQSKCFQHVYQHDYNVIVSAPTGSGKTVVMELAICRLVNSLKDGLFKVIYQAPTRSLCAERFRDWSTKFTSLGLQCAELTGDTDFSQLRSIQTASIIITTPEKWDSITRKWRDHAKLMQLVKLFLIDEVHVLNESRGACLEAVVSRMKSVGSNVRFIALSATIPNSEDIAAWLGRDPTLQHLPAHREHFGEEFRPVKLQKFVYGYQSNGNDFAFDRFCGTKLPEIIAKHSSGKPIMIFCCTRNSVIATSKDLANMWTNTNPRKRLWSAGNRQLVVKNSDLRIVIAAGVAFHHAGLDSEDRRTVETGFLEGKINIICSTSTLAVGVNLPCHLVIIKNTVCWQDGGCKEYSDLDMMQMLGRAGRPQFDDTAVAVILTKKERVAHYERLVSGSEQLESCLHRNLIDHLNAEIGLGTVTDLDSATKWLAGTFLFVRLRRNPTHYKLKENADRKDEDEMLCQICEKDVALLQECELVSTDGKFMATPFGDAMAKYYVKFETMKVLLSLPSKAKISEILSAIAQADEFHEVRLKAGERSLYKEINRSHGIRFAIKVDVAQQAHKISLLIQSELGAVEYPSTEQFQKHKLQFQQDKTLVFTHINRLIRCVIDCQIHIGDGIAVRNALELARSFAARVWESSPLQMKQIDQIGIVAVRKLTGAGITNIEALEDTEAHRIDMILSKNPPFGTKLLARLADFPKLRVMVKMGGKAARHGKSVSINFRAEIGFLNEKLPAFFQRRPVYVCFLAESSDGRLIDFRRMSAKKLQNSHEILLSTELTSVLQHITCYVMCDHIAGTVQYAQLQPDVPESWFSKNLPETGAAHKLNEKSTNNWSRPWTNVTKRSNRVDSFEDEDLQDDDMIAAAADTNWFELSRQLPARSRRKSHLAMSVKKEKEESNDQEEQILLANGKWECNHKCKDKTACKHFCCREGLDKPPKSAKKHVGSATDDTPQAKHSQLTSSGTTNKQLGLVSNIAPSDDEFWYDSAIDFVDLTQVEAIFPRSGDRPGTKAAKGPDALKAMRMAKLDLACSQPASQKKSVFSPTPGKKVKRSRSKRNRSSSDYGDSDLELDNFLSSLVSPSKSDHQRGDTYDGIGFPPTMGISSVDDNIDDLPPLEDLPVLLRKDDPPAEVGKRVISGEERKTSSPTLVLSSSWSFGNPSILGVSPRSIENVTSPDTSDSRAKRQTSPLQELSDTRENIRKRMRFENPLIEPSEKENATAASASVQEASNEQGSAPQWEGIDQSLLEEYGDIVNFF